MLFRVSARLSYFRALLARIIVVSGPAFTRVDGEACCTSVVNVDKQRLSPFLLMRGPDPPPQQLQLSDPFIFEIDSSSKALLAPSRLRSKPCYHATALSSSDLLTSHPCSASIVFQTRPDLHSLAVKRCRQRSRCNDACFASLLQSFSKSKRQSQPKPTATDNKPQSGEAKALGVGKHLLCGALSAVVSRTTMAPLERIKLEIVLHKRQDTMFEVALGVFDQNGVQGFWKGNGLNILRTAPYKAMLMFAAYLHLHTYLH